MALEMASLSSETKVLDLYCGTGTIGMFAKTFCKCVLGIEMNAQAVEDGRENILLNGMTGMTILEGDVGSAHIKYENPDVIFVDPPRVGLSKEAVNQILNLSPKKLVYISCNPRTQAENCELLVQGGYHIQKIQPVDQFPHTPHIENIVALVRSL